MIYERLPMLDPDCCDEKDIPGELKPGLDPFWETEGLALRDVLIAKEMITLVSDVESCAPRISGDKILQSVGNPHLAFPKLWNMPLDVLRQAYLDTLPRYEFREENTLFKYFEDVYQREIFTPAEQKIFRTLAAYTPDFLRIPNTPKNRELMLDFMSKQGILHSTMVGYTDGEDFDPKEIGRYWAAQHKDADPEVVQILADNFGKEVDSYLNLCCRVPWFFAPYWLSAHHKPFTEEDELGFLESEFCSTIVFSDDESEV